MRYIEMLREYVPVIMFFAGLLIGGINNGESE